LLKQAVEVDNNDYYEALDYGSMEASKMLPEIDLNPISHASKRPAAPVAEDSGTHKKVKRSHVHRREHRNQRVQQDGHQPSAKNLRAIMEQAANFTLEVPIILNDLPASSCGYRAKPNGPPKAGVHDLEHYLLLRL
jgi:hypothetical protein